MATLTTQLKQLENAQLVRRALDEDLSYLFKHALTQETAYGSLLLKRRREIHRRVAETIERLWVAQLDEQAARLAEHYYQAGDQAKTFEFALRAADNARALFAYVEARSHYARALDALARLPDTEENRRRRVDTLVKLVTVALRSDGPDLTLERLKEAESILLSLPPEEGDRERLAYIQYWTGHAYVHRGQPVEAIGYMRQVLAAAQEGVGGPELLAIPASVIGRALSVKGQFSEGEALLAQAIEPLANAANWHEWILTVGTRAWVLAALGQAQPAIAEGERVLRKAEETGTLVGIAQSHLALAIVCWQSGEYERMRVESTQIVQTSEKGGDRFLTAVGLGFASWSEALLGNIDIAEELSRRFLSLGATIGPRLLLADWFAAARAEMALLGGRLDDALTRAREAVDLAHEVASPFSEGLAERVWGRAVAQIHFPNWAEAEAHLATSLQSFEAGQAWLEAARTHVAWGQVLALRGNADAAREHFEKAAAQFESSGLTNDLERTKGLIAPPYRRECASGFCEEDSQMATLTTQLEQLENAQLVRPLAEEELAYLFKHALTQQTAYESLLHKSQREIHRRVAQAFEQLDADHLDEDAALLAFHYGRAGEDAKTVDYAARAGDAATRLYAYAEARHHYALAVEALGRLAETLENRRRRVDLVTKLVKVAFASESPEELLERLAEVEPIARELPDLSGHSGKDRLRLALIHFWMGRMHYQANRPREAIDYYVQVLKVAPELGDPELLAIPSSMLGRAMLTQGQFGKAAALLSQATVPMESTGNMQEWSSTLGYLSIARAQQGFYQEALELGRRCRAVADQTKNFTSIALSHLYLNQTYFFGGDLQHCLDECLETVNITDKTGDRVIAYVALGFQAWAESRLRRHEAARETMARWKSVAASLGGRLIVADWFAAANAELAFNARRLREALALAEEAVTLGKSLNGLFGEGEAQRVWGQALVGLGVQEWAEAESHLAMSVQTLESGEAHLEAARTHLAWGLCLRDRGDHSAALQHFEKAAAQFQTSGLAHELDQTQQLIASLPYK